MQILLLIVFDQKVENFIVMDVKRDWDIIVGALCLQY